MTEPKKRERAIANRKTFTDLGLKRLRPPKHGQELYWDEGQRGLSLLVSPGGTKTFRVTFKLNGKWISHKIGRFGEMVPGADAKTENVQVAEAHKITRDWRALANKGIDPRKQQSEQLNATSLTYGQVVERFIEEHAKHEQRTWDQTERVLKSSCAAWWSKPIASITKDDARALIARARTEGKHYKAILTLSWLKRLWRFAADCEYVPVPIMDRVKIKLARPPRTRLVNSKPVDPVYNDVEIRAIWNAADKLEREAGAFIKLLILLGPRKTALAMMRRSDLEFDGNGKPVQWVTPFEFTKSWKTAKKERKYVTPLPGLAQRVLASMLTDTPADGRVFPSLPVWRSKAGSHILRSQRLLRLLIARGAPKDFSFHLMRHTLATWLQKNNHSDWEIGLILNHAGTGVTSGYIHGIAFDLKLKLLSEWSDHVEGVVKPAKGVRGAAVASRCCAQGLSLTNRERLLRWCTDNHPAVWSRSTINDTTLRKARCAGF